MSKPFIFILMPFDPKFDDIYKLGIKPTCEEAGAYCERVDEQIYQGSILDRIVNQISKADIIIADMSGQNPNVFFETGYAKALDKKLIFLTSCADEIPFDLKHYAHIVYDNISSLKEKLKTPLFHYLNNLDGSASEILFDIELYILGTELRAGEVTRVEVSEGYQKVDLSVKNISGRIIDPRSLQLTASPNDGSIFYRNKEKKYLQGTEGQKIASIFNSDPIFPESLDTYMICALQADIFSKLISLSAYTSKGTRDFEVEFLRSNKK